MLRGSPVLLVKLSRTQQPVSGLQLTEYLCSVCEGHVEEAVFPWTWTRTNTMLAGPLVAWEMMMLTGMRNLLG